MNAVRWLRESGLTVGQLPGREAAGYPQADAILRVEVGGQHALFAVELRRRAPYPGELAILQPVSDRLSRQGQPLLVAPFVSEPLGTALTGTGWSWADGDGNFDLRAPGLVLRQRRAAAPRKLARKTLPRGSGSFAVIRALLGSDAVTEEGIGATALAVRAHVTQPRVSQVLRQLQDQKLVGRAGRSRWLPDRDKLLERFLAEYPGPGGGEHYFYSLLEPTEAALHAARTLGPALAVSADVGPDLVASWRRPSVVILYVKKLPDTADWGLVEAQGRHDANVIIRMPADHSVFSTPPLVAAVHGTEIGLADPTQMIWDLQDLGGSDREEAAGRLREWLLTRP